jgi:hypothetical protein
MKQQLITPTIFSAPSPPKQQIEEKEESPKSKRDRSSGNKNSASATSPSTKHKSPVREEVKFTILLISLFVFSPSPKKME